MGAAGFEPTTNKYLCPRELLRKDLEPAAIPGCDNAYNLSKIFATPPGTLNAIFSTLF